MLLKVIKLRGFGKLDIACQKFGDTAPKRQNSAKNPGTNIFPDIIVCISKPKTSLPLKNP